MATKKTADLTPGSNQPVLSYEVWAEEAQKALRQADRSGLKAGVSVIMALVIAHGQDATNGQVDITQLWQLEGREFTAALDCILLRVFGVRAQDAKGNYYIPGSTSDLSKQNRRSGTALGQPILIKAAATDRMVRALTQTIRRKAETVAVLCQEGGAFHAQTNPSGVVRVNADGRLEVPNRFWFDRISAEPGGSLYDLWTKHYAAEMTREQGDLWLVLDGTRGFEGLRTLDALSANARRRLHGPQKRPPRASVDEKAAEFIKAVQQRDSKGVVVKEAAHYVNHFISARLAKGEPPADRVVNEQFAGMLAGLLVLYCTEGDQLDMEKVQAFFDLEPREALAA